MTTSQILAAIGAAAGTLGSILTAFSINGVVSVLNTARKALELSNEMAAMSNDRLVVNGLDKQVQRASRKGAWLLWVGVSLLAAGFILQALGVLWVPVPPSG